MNEISGVPSQHQITSKLKVSLESMQKQRHMEAPLEMNEIKQFEIKMDQFHYAFALAKEIRSSLESALRDLAP